MANHDVEPIFNDQLRKLETTDPAHADVFNALYGQLINNDAWLKKKIEEGGGGGGGGGDIEYATDEEVQEVIDNLDGGGLIPPAGSGYASNEEVQEMIDELDTGGSPDIITDDDYATNEEIEDVISDFFNDDKTEGE